MIPNNNDIKNKNKNKNKRTLNRKVGRKRGRIEVDIFVHIDRPPKWCLELGLNQHWFNENYVRVELGVFVEIEFVITWNSCLGVQIKIANFLHQVFANICTENLHRCQRIFYNVFKFERSKMTKLLGRYGQICCVCVSAIDRFIKKSKYKC